MKGVYADPEKIGKESFAGVSKTGWIVWIIASVSNWLVIAVIIGTAEHYYPTAMPLFFGLYISVEAFWTFFGMSIWLVLSGFVFKFFRTKVKNGLQKTSSKNVKLSKNSKNNKNKKRR